MSSPFPRRFIPYNINQTSMTNKLTQVTVMIVVCGFAPKSPRAQVSLLHDINIPNVPLSHSPGFLALPVLSFSRNEKECYSVHIFIGISYY